ncbi:MAG: LysR family transcriptional regulator [Lachnospiraceae bacterium]|nr:LysR family transcriptional regulator [Lachnospiraceae bacterium]
MEQNLSLYRIFFEVAQTGNISRAAKNLYISQPAISKAISRLEDNLHLPLFIRNSRGVQLTDEGQILYEHVQEAFETLNHGEDELKRMMELGVGHIRIGVSTVLCKYVLLPCLKEFIARYPHVKFTIHNQSTLQTLELLEKQQIDLGLTAEPSHNKKTITFDKVMDIEDGFVATPAYLTNMRLREGAAQSDIFKNGTILMLDKGNVSRTYIEDYLREQHLEPAHLLEVSTMDLLVDFTRIGLGAGCVIKNFVREELENGTFVEIPMSPPIPGRTIGFACNSQSVHSKALTMFIRFYRHFYHASVSPLPRR